MKDKHKNKLTPTHITLFKNYCLQFQKELGLMNYRLYFEYKDIRSYSQCERNHPGGVVTITVPKYYPEKITTKSLRDTAFHEMLHTLLGGYEFKAKARYVTESELEEEEEHIVNALENYFSSLHK